MSLKRKRSSDNLSPSSSSACSYSMSSRDSSPIAFPYTFRHNTHTIDTMPSPNMQTYSPANGWLAGPTPNLHSRTKKRLRNNRPAESEVFASTYELLFSGARAPKPNPPQATHLPHPQNPQSDASTSRQSSLHKFWTLPAPPASNPHVTAGPEFQTSSDTLNCEDCDAPLQFGNGDVSMGGMDMDLANPVFDEDDCRCMSCGRLVCATCAVVETGAGRECLECRMR